ncbi:MAG: hypothetical protein ABWY12_19150 [Burkholderiales bacterium]
MNRVLCASKPLTSYSGRMPPTVLATLDDAGVKDLRGRYWSAASDHWTIAIGFAKQSPELAG